MTDNVQKNKNQHNDSIEHELNFDNKFRLSGRNKDLLPVVTVILRGGKKQRATIISSLTCLWDSGYNNIMIHIKHTKHYDFRIGYNKL